MPIFDALVNSTLCKLDISYRLNSTLGIKCIERIELTKVSKFDWAAMANALKSYIRTNASLIIIVVGFIMMELYVCFMATNYLTINVLWPEISYRYNF